jgi:hypothetical protein
VSRRTFPIFRSATRTATTTRCPPTASTTFEWTPFTPAIRAWERAQRHLRNARDLLVEARKIKGFAIPGLEHDCEHFKGQLKVLIDDVDEATWEARTVVQVLDVANTDYARAHDASRDEYQRLRDVIDQTLEDQGRRRL